ncbi:hypothetical protein BJV74DRAFT_587430 [Russula compacta]|nr:hypothetical protein BJV74DRAFT_587430 [Russula compacta]
MVNFYDPAILEQDHLAAMGLWHTINGIYIWEFVTNLDYELDIIRGRRPYRRTIWLYSITRLAALAAVILNFVGADVTTPYDCQAWIIFGLLSGYLAFATASLLVVLRIIAIWNKDKVIVAVATTVWTTNVIGMIVGIVRIRSAWEPTQRVCYTLNMESQKFNIVISLANDIALLLIMVVGLLRLRYHSDGAFKLGRLLWKQGVMWLLIATAVEVPPTILIILNLNEPLTTMFQPPTVLAMSIAATRMYRALSDFIPESMEISQVGNRVSKKKSNSSDPVIFKKIEVTVDAVHEDTIHIQHPMSQMGLDGSSISIDEQPDEKLHRLSLDKDAENNV